MSSAAARLSLPPPTRDGFDRWPWPSWAHAALLAVLTMGYAGSTTFPVVAVEAELWSALPAAGRLPPVVPLPPKPPPQPDRPVALPPPAPRHPTQPRRIAKEKRASAKSTGTGTPKTNTSANSCAPSKNGSAEQRSARQALRQACTPKKLQKTKSAPKRPNSKIQTAGWCAANQFRRIARSRDRSRATVMPAIAGTAGPGPVRQLCRAHRSHRIKPNITYTGPSVGSPVADGGVQTSPDGTIIQPTAREIQGSSPGMMPYRPPSTRPRKFRRRRWTCHPVSNAGFQAALISAGNPATRNASLFHFGGGRYKVVRTL